MSRTKKHRVVSFVLDEDTGDIHAQEQDGGDTSPAALESFHGIFSVSDGYNVEAMEDLFVDIIGRDWQQRPPSLKFKWGGGAAAGNRERVVGSPNYPAFVPGGRRDGGGP